MSMTSDPDGGGSKKRIEEAAVNLFADMGYARTTTSAIAKRAGVNEVTLFRIFGSKRELLREVYYQMTPDAEQVALPSLTSTTDIGDELAPLLRSYLLLHLGHMPAYRLSLQLQEELNDKEFYHHSFRKIEGMIAQFVAYLRALRANGRIAEADYSALAEYLFSLFLIKAQEYTSLGLPPDAPEIEAFIASYSRYLGELLRPIP